MKRDRENFTIPFLSADIQLNRSPHLMQKTRATSFLVPHFGQTSVMELASGLCVTGAGADSAFTFFVSVYKAIVRSAHLPRLLRSHTV